MRIKITAHQCKNLLHHPWKTDGRQLLRHSGERLHHIIGQQSKKKTEPPAVSSHAGVSLEK